MRPDFTPDQAFGTVPGARSTMKQNILRFAALAAFSLVARGGVADEAPAPPAPAAAPAAPKAAEPPKNDDPKIAFTKYKLENGLEVILHQDRTAPVAYVSLW